MTSGVECGVAARTERESVQELLKCSSRVLEQSVVERRESVLEEF
jgi:hypothetical protein